MKPGVSYAISLAIALLAIVLLVQHRKLAAERATNASLRGDARARVTAHYAETAELMKEIRQLRSENEQLRRDLDARREHIPTRDSERD